MRAAKETLVLLGKSLRLVWRHWPTLVVLAFGGFILRQVLIKAAALASELHRVVGMLLFALAPLGMLIALVLMLRVVRPSLPAVSAAMDEVAGRNRGVRGMLAHMASVLVPFLIVYASFDYFTEDKASYSYQIFEDEVLANADSINNPAAVDLASRLPGTLDTLTIILVAAAALLRWMIGLWKRGQGKTLVGFGNAYLEVVWMTMAAAAFSELQDDLMNRRFSVWADTLWQGFLEKLGPLSPVGEFLGGLFLAADSIIVVPLAWLAVGAIVYGRKLDQGADLLPPPARKRWLRMPTALRSDVSESFGPLMRGLSQLRHAGLAPMLLFCLAFVVARTFSSWLWQLERLIIGPNDLASFWWPLSGPLSAVNDAIGAILLICLVAVAVDRALSLQPAEPTLGPTTGQGSAAHAEPGVAGQIGGAGYPHGNGPRVTGRDEENEGLIPV